MRDRSSSITLRHLRRRPRRPAAAARRVRALLLRPLRRVPDPSVLHVGVHVLFLAAVLLIIPPRATAASASAADVTPDGNVKTNAAPPSENTVLPAALRYLDVPSPPHRHSYGTAEVPIRIDLRPTSPPNIAVCLTQTVDRYCAGFADGPEAESFVDKVIQADADARARRRCAPHPPMAGRMELPATCHLLVVEAVRMGAAKEEEEVLERLVRPLRVDAVDAMVTFAYPRLPNLGGGESSRQRGEGAAYQAATESMGPGLILQFGAGAFATTTLATYVTALKRRLLQERGATGGRDGVVHSFDSFEGLEEAWRPGFAKGSFRSVDDSGKPGPDFDVPDNVVLHQGDVRTTTQTFLDTEQPDAPIGLIVLDLMVHPITQHVLDTVACRLSADTVLVFHNFFNYRDWSDTRGERSAWLEAVEEHGIEFDEVGFVSTLYVVKVKGVPTKCPAAAPQESSGGRLPPATGAAAPPLDPSVREWSVQTLQAARTKRDMDHDDADLARTCEVIVAVDPFYGDALGILAFALDDPHRVADRMDYARRALLVQHAAPIPGPEGADPKAMLESLHKDPSHERPFDLGLRKHRLRHDLEQLRYLRDLGERIPPDVLGGAIAAYEETLTELSGRSDGDWIELSWTQWKRIGPFFNRALHIPPAPRVALTESDGAALDAAVNYTDVVTDYQTQDNSVVVVDDILSDLALKRLLKYYREATVFYGVGHPSYVGSYLTDGVGNPLLAQVVEEISYKLRDIICDRPLVQGWVYKYDEHMQRGINIHADKAAVNINIWLSPDNSMDEDRTGGLVVYTRKPPEDWDFNKFNADPTPKPVLDMLEDSGWSNVTVPYKQNRMVVFDSKLFHVSDVGKWKPGYAKRRINLTLLFGRMGSTCEQQHQNT